MKEGGCSVGDEPGGQWCQEYSAVSSVTDEQVLYDRPLLVPFPKTY